MARTFSEQLKQGQVSRLTRTKRLQLQVIQEKEKQKFEQLQTEAERLKEELSNLPLEQYKERYYQLPLNLRQFFVSPEEIEIQQEKAEQQQREIAEKTISEWQTKLENAEVELQKYEEWWNRLSDKYKEKRREDYKESRKEIKREIAEYKDKIKYLQLQKGRIKEGYNIGDIIDYAIDKAEYNREKSEAKAKAISEFEKQLKEGVSPELYKNLNTLGLTVQTTYKEYEKKAKEYNIELAYKQQLGRWAEKEGIEKLPSWAREKISPEWEESYQKYLKQQEDIEKSKAYLKEKGFTEDVSFTAPEQTMLGKAWSGIKTIYLSSLFGAGYKNIVETEQKELIKERYKRTGEAISPTVSFIGVPFTFDASKFFTVSLGTAWEKIQKQRELNYRKEEAEKLLLQLSEYSKEVSPEMKTYVEVEGIKMLQERGLKVTETTSFDLSQKTEEGKFPTLTTLTITDEAFDRRISQNWLEWERAREKEDKFGQVIIGSRMFSSSAMETLLLFYGLGKVATEGYKVYKSLKLPSITFYKTIELQEGYAKVPIDFSKSLTVLGMGLTGLYGYAKYKEYQYAPEISPYGREAFLLETLGQLTGIELATGIGKRTVDKTVNRIKNWSLERKKEADISMKGFMRYNERLGMEERIYMERYKGFKISKPKTWLQWLKGYEKGQFTGQVKKFMTDELTAFYKYGGDVTLYDKGGKITKTIKASAESIKADYGIIKYEITDYEPSQIIEKISGEPFPYGEATTQTARQKEYLEWFMKKNIQEFGIGKYSELPIDVKGKAFGYSATGEAWVGTEFEPMIISYDEGTKALVTKGAYQYVSGKGVSGGFTRVFQKGTYEEISKTATDPIIYANYFDNVQLNKALREIKGTDILTDREVRAFIYAKDTGKAGTLNIGGLKREVEGTSEVIKRILIRKKYAVVWEGWKVPFEEQIFTEISQLSQEELKAIIKSVGRVEELSGIAYSDIPSKAHSFKGIFSLAGYSKPPSKRQYSISRISKVSESGVSKISGMLKVSGISEAPTSRINEILRTSLVSEILSKASYIPYRTPKSRISKPLLPKMEYLKVKVKGKARKYPEIIGLFPDFTARVLGLEPKVVSLKDAMKEISKIQTGFEVRRGARIKEISDKELMKGIIA